MVEKIFLIFKKYFVAGNKSNIDFLSLERGELETSDVVKDLIKVMEEYTNGGLTIIQEKFGKIIQILH